MQCMVSPELFELISVDLSGPLSTERVETYICSNRYFSKFVKLYLIKSADTKTVARKIIIILRRWAVQKWFWGSRYTIY